MDIKVFIMQRKCSPEPISQAKYPVCRGSAKHKIDILDRYPTYQGVPEVSSLKRISATANLVQCLFWDNNNSRTKVLAAHHQ